MTIHVDPSQFQGSTLGLLRLVHSEFYVITDSLKVRGSRSPDIARPTGSRGMEIGWRSAYRVVEN